MPENPIDDWASSLDAQLNAHLAQAAQPFAELTEQLQELQASVNAIAHEDEAKTERRTTVILMGLLVGGLAWVQVGFPLVRGVVDTVQNEIVAPIQQAAKPVQDFFSPDLNKVPQTGDQIGGYEVTSGWGPRSNPCPGCSSYHRGIDVGAPIGSPVYAVGKTAKTTVECLPDDGMGKQWVRQTSPDFPDLRFEMLHLSACNPGEYPPGAVVASSGDAGTGPHYHFQIRKISLEGNDPAQCGNVGSCNGLFEPPLWAIQAMITGQVAAAPLSKPEVPNASK